MYQVKKELGKMRAPLLFVQRYSQDALLALDLAKPVLDAFISGSFKNRSNALCKSRRQRTGSKALPYRLDELWSAHRLEQNLICLQQDCLGGGVHFWEGCQQHCYSGRIRMSHRAYDGQAVASSWHMKIA